MRIHSDTLTEQQIRDALNAERESGRIAKHVGFKRLTQHRSRTHATSFEVQLEGAVADRGRRLGNSGSYGAGQDYAATYDEWGWLLAALYKIDRFMVVGSVNHPVYGGSHNFREATGWTYAPEMLIEHLERGHDDPFPYVIGKGTGPDKGRFGYGRSDGDTVHGRRVYYNTAELNAAYERWQQGKKQGNEYVKYLPRTVEQIRSFAHLVTEGA